MGDLVGCPIEIGVAVISIALGYGNPARVFNSPGGEYLMERHHSDSQTFSGFYRSRPIGLSLQDCHISVKE
jgi:hypothetical protein